MFVWVGKEADEVIVIGQVISAKLCLYWPSCVSIGRVASVLAEILCIGRVCRSYDLDSFCHTNTVSLTVN